MIKLTNERNVNISLDKAREWYNKGGELKEIALSAFSDEEIKASMLPNTWEEFCNLYPIKEKECYIAVDCTLSEIGGCPRFSDGDKNILPSKEAAKAHLAYMQLHQLRDCYRQGWVPDWEDAYQNKWVIFYVYNKYIIEQYSLSSRFLSFQSMELAEKFLNNFKDLIKTAGDLI